MGKVIDISSKLSMNIRPTLMFGEYVLDVNADAESTMRIMGLSKKLEAKEIDEEGMIMQALKILFGEDMVPELQKVLLFSDLAILAKIGMNLATNKDPYDGLEEEAGEESPEPFPGE